MTYEQIKNLRPLYRKLKAEAVAAGDTRRARFLDGADQVLLDLMAIENGVDAERHLSHMYGSSNLSAARRAVRRSTQAGRGQS